MMEKAEPRENSGHKSRTSRYIKLSLGLILIAMGLVYYWYQSPTYAVLELETAIEEKDLATFYSRLDLNRIYDSTLDAGAVLETQSESPWETLQANLGAGVQKVLKSQVMNEVKRDIELQFRRDGALPSAPGETKPAPLSLPREFFQDSVGLKFGKPVRSGDSALVNIEVVLKKMAKSYPLTLKMEKLGSWKVTGFEGLASTVSIYKQDRMLRVTEYNTQMEKEFVQLVPFFGQLREEPNLLNIGQDLKFEFLFQNKSESALDRIEGQLLVQNAKGETVLKESFVRDGLNLSANEKKVFLLSKDIGVLGSKVVFADGLTLSFQMEKVEFRGGRVLRIAKNYEEI